MTRRRRVRQAQGGPSSPLRREDVAALATLARGYLHEDFEAEHGSAAGAVAAFLADASDEERQAVTRDLGRLAREARHWTLGALQQFVTRELGSAWRPESMDDLEHLERVVRRQSGSDE